MTNPADRLHLTILSTGVFGVRIQNSEITGSGKRRFATRTGTQRAPFRSGESEKDTKNRCSYQALT